jgi:hypothetical protein
VRSWCFRRFDDRTVSIAQSYEPRIRVVVFEKNRGYGAAIQEGWRVGGGDLLGFIDATDLRSCCKRPMCERRSPARRSCSEPDAQSKMPHPRVGNRLLRGYSATCRRRK